MPLPSSGPLSMSQIAAELAPGQFNLGYYIGRTYYNGATPVTISAVPDFAEFYGLGLGTPWPISGGVSVGGSVYTVFTNGATLVRGLHTTGVMNSSFPWQVYNANAADANVPCPGIGQTVQLPFVGTIGGFNPAVPWVITVGMQFRLSLFVTGLGPATVDLGNVSDPNNYDSGFWYPHTGAMNICDSSSPGWVDSAVNLTGFGPAPGTLYNAVRALINMSSQSIWFNLSSGQSDPGAYPDAYATLTRIL